MVKQFFLRSDAISSRQWLQCSSILNSERAKILSDVTRERLMIAMWIAILPIGALAFAFSIAFALVIIAIVWIRAQTRRTIPAWSR